ncbi:hypothetical protein JWG39_07465 [Desulforhopalus vacuolatus]|uniref:hypothetical protein n=1 Tax=Desulforhopalus vacuolatus TaxID=40414 RepID=UPI001965B839|nr:hypothetical protein [Desulforhopalus vacuolatus]MBM9519658.1 hypothetical protein [Desulforhopalus vacuolatus]
MAFISGRIAPSAREKTGVTTVPSMIFNDLTRLVGAWSVEEDKKVLSQLSKGEQRSQNPSLS